jgi:hypothetical protein
MSLNCDRWAKVVKMDIEKDLTLLSIIDDSEFIEPPNLLTSVDGIIGSLFTMFGLSFSGDSKFIPRTGSIIDIVEVCDY